MQVGNGYDCDGDFTDYADYSPNEGSFVDNDGEFVGSGYQDWWYGYAYYDADLCEVSSAQLCLCTCSHQRMGGGSSHRVLVVGPSGPGPSEAELFY